MSNHQDAAQRQPRLTQLAGIHLPSDPEKATVASACPAFWRMLPFFDFADDFVDGDDAIQAATSTYLPRYAAEKPQDYQRRLSGTVLTPGFARAVDANSLRPFEKSVKVQQGCDDAGEPCPLPYPLDRIEKRVSGGDEDLTAFARSLLFDGTKYGPAGFLVDMPEVLDGTSPADVERQRLWPGFRAIPARDLFWWSEGVDEAGDPTIDAIRWLDLRSERVGLYGMREFPIIRSMSAPEFGERGMWTTHVLEGSGTDAQWVLEESGEHEFPGLPFVWGQFGPRKAKRIYECRPPLYHIARMNLAHLRSASRQSQYVERVRIATAFLSGVDKTELEEGLLVGPNQIKGVKNPNAKLSFHEHSGAAAQTGWDDLDRWELKMAVASLEPLRSKTGTPTATGKAIDTAESTSDIQSRVRLLEIMLERGYEHAATWAKEELPEGWGIDIWASFRLSLTTGEDLDRIMKLHERGGISTVTMTSEFVARGALSDRVDPEAEIERRKEEAQAELELARFAIDDDGDQGQGEPDPEGKDDAA